METVNNNLYITFSTKEDGNMSKKYSKDINNTINNKKKFFQKEKITNSIILLTTNKDIIVEIDNNYDLTKDINADAAITKNKTLFLYINFADCVPLVIYDKKQNIMAFAHLGWKSTVLDLHKKVINLFLNKYNSNPKDLIAYLGPSIKKETYIVKSTHQIVSDNLIKDYVKNTKDDLYSIDLQGYIIDGIKELGITEIINSDIDTGSNENMFSHHRCTKVDSNELEGRFICGVMMKEDE